MSLTLETLSAASASLERLDTVKFTASDAKGDGEVRKELVDAVDHFRREFTTSLEDDLGIAGGMASLFEIVSSIHRINNERNLNYPEGQYILQLWREVDAVLGFLFNRTDNKKLPAEISELVRQRIEARKNKNFADSDKIRDKLLKKGYQIEDTRESTIIIWSEGREIIK